MATSFDQKSAAAKDFLSVDWRVLRSIMYTQNIRWNSLILPGLCPADSIYVHTHGSRQGKQVMLTLQCMYMCNTRSICTTWRCVVLLRTLLLFNVPDCIVLQTTVQHCFLGCTA